MRRAAVAVALSIALLVTTTVAVLVFGIIPLPDYPSLAANPNPAISGTVAFMTYEDTSCLYVVQASGGETKQLMCGLFDRTVEPSGLAWTPDGLIEILTYSGQSPVYQLIDPSSGEIVGTAPFGEDGLKTDTYISQDGSTVFPDNARGTAQIRVAPTVGPIQTVLTVKGPRDYGFGTTIWSPDGQWILAIDSEGTILVLGADGEPGPAILASGGSSWMGVAWYQP